MIIYRAAAACGLALEMVEKCGVHVPGLPLGGGALAQLGVVFGVAFLLTEGQVTLAHAGHSLSRLVGRSLQKVRRWRQHMRRPPDAGQP